MLKISFIMFLVLVPFYVFGSGSFQLSDFFLFISFFLTLVVAFRKNIDVLILFKKYPSYPYLLAFSSYVILVALLWSIYLQSFIPIEKAMFAPMGVIVITTILLLYEYFGHSFLKIITHSIIASVFILTFLSPLVIIPGLRQQLFFNNPNQLGYYAVASASIIFAAFDLSKNRLVGISAFICICYFVMISVSRAAIVSIAFLAVAFLFKKNNVLPFVLSILVLSVVSISNLNSIQNSELFINFNERLETKSNENVDRASERGYTRIYNFPEYLLFGASEGLYERFNETLELHSTWLSIVFCYGFIGFALFVLMFFNSIQKSTFIAFVPVVLYGLTHNGIRFRLFWILLATLIVLKRDKQQTTLAG